VASKRYTFPGNQLPYGWTATRLSAGGQNNGVWTREIKDNKIYWVGVGVGTESSWWGEKLSIPVNAVGDIIIDATIRQKANTSADSNFGVGFNLLLVAYPIRFGTSLILPGAANNYKYSFNNASATPFPGFPSKTAQGPMGGDFISNLRIVRKNGYVALYMDNLLMGSFAYASTITSVDILSTWYIANISCQKWLQDLSIYPSSVVL